MALAILGVVVLFGTGFFVKRKEVERERLDRDVAIRALRSEWAYLRTSPLSPRKDAPFVGSEAFLETVAARDPRLTITPTETAGLLLVHLEISSGLKRRVRIAQEGLSFTGGAAP